MFNQMANPQPQCDVQAQFSPLDKFSKTKCTFKYESFDIGGTIPFRLRPVLQFYLHVWNKWKKCLMSYRESVCPAHDFYHDFPTLSPQGHRYLTKPRAGECNDGRVGERLRMGVPSTRGSKGTSRGMSLAKIDGDGGGDLTWAIPKGDGVHGALMIDLHTTLIMVQLHMPIMQKANHLCTYLV